MKTTIFILVLFISNIIIAQDIIIKKSGDEIKATVTEVGTENIKYKKFGSESSPIYVISKTELFMIKYQDGTKDMFNDEETAKKEEVQEIITPKVDETLNKQFTASYSDGQNDAKKHYKGYQGAGTGVFVTSMFFSPLIGLIPAAASSSTVPKDENLMYPNSELMKNVDYANGYRKEALKIKSKKVWTNWGVSVGISVVLVTMLMASQQ